MSTDKTRWKAVENKKQPRGKQKRTLGAHEKAIRMNVTITKMAQGSHETDQNYFYTI